MATHWTNRLIRSGRCPRAATTASSAWPSSPLAQVRACSVCESGKLRARQTAEIAAARLAPGVAIETVRGLNPNDAVEPWVEIVNGGSADTLLVGHMPFLGRLVARLLASGVPACVTFTPGSLACLQRRGDAWSLEWMLRPELLR